MPLAVAGHTSVPAGVLGAVLLAAVLHAAWNAFAHASRDRLAAFALIGISATACGAVIALAAPVPDRSSWPFIAVSVSLHTAYNLLLVRSYERAEFSQVYPLARGVSPWLVAIAAAVFAQESLTAARLGGVIVISIGLASLVLAGGRPTRDQRPALVAAVLTGVAIAAYTTVDGLGVRHSGTASDYAGWLFLGEGPVLPIVAVLCRPNRLWPQPRADVLAGLTGGVLSIAAYALVLWAQTRGALAPVAALRETSVVIGAIIGAIVFHERFGRWRIAATVLVAAGVVLLNL